MDRGFKSDMLLTNARIGREALKCALPPKTHPAGGEPPQQVMVEGGEPLHVLLHVGHLLPDGKEVLISRHPACKAKVE